jgi:hypothetical protein
MNKENFIIRFKPCEREKKKGEKRARIHPCASLAQGGGNACIRPGRTNILMTQKRKNHSRYFMYHLFQHLILSTSLSSVALAEEDAFVKTSARHVRIPTSAFRVPHSHFPLLTSSAAL